MMPYSVYESLFWFVNDVLQRGVDDKKQKFCLHLFDQACDDAGYCIDAPDILPAGACAFGLYEWECDCVIAIEPGPLQLLAVRAND